MRIISFIEDQAVVKTILQYLGIRAIRSKPPAKAHAPPARKYAADNACQTAFPDNTAYGDPDYLRGLRISKTPTDFRKILCFNCPLKNLKS